MVLLNDSSKCTFRLNKWRISFCMTITHCTVVLHHIQLVRLPQHTVQQHQQLLLAQSCWIWVLLPKRISSSFEKSNRYFAQQERNNFVKKLKKICFVKKKKLKKVFLASFSVYIFNSTNKASFDMNCY